MVRIFTVFAMLMAGALVARAQPAPAQTESVTVTGTKSREVLDKFVKSFATPTLMTGKIARWESGICPLTVGQQPAVTKFVTQRVRDVAAMVGAPVNARQSCTPNIEIVFTTTPQALLDNVRAKEPDYLGYAESSAEKDKLATVTRPLQAWYATETIDLDGIHRIDGARRLGGGIAMSNFTALPMPTGGVPNRDPIYMPDATYARVTGNHISNGVRSGLNHVIIVADVKKLTGYEAGPTADYIAMLALTQLNSLDMCQQLPSIVNMLAPGCETQKSDVLTENDLAYLSGLYKMNPDKRLLAQQDEIADRMSEARKGQ